LSWILHLKSAADSEIEPTIAQSFRKVDGGYENPEIALKTQIDIGSKRVAFESIPKQLRTSH
jgi:hypothetical protein